jgi:predicted RNA binding protein YcfA (HicA-like mRNA interferase family)
MKRRELERRLKALGWKLERHGAKHDVWSNENESFAEYVPRHAELQERLARMILERAKERR